MTWNPRRWLVPAGALVLWFAFGLFVTPALLESLHVAGTIPAMADNQVDFFLEEWRAIVYYGAFAGVAVLLFVHALRTPALARRIVPDARPTDLGAIRVLVGSILLISTLWEDVASTASIPREVMDPIGFMQLLALLPGYDAFAASEPALRIFEWLTALVLLLGAVGWRTNVTVPLGAILYLLLGGLLRQYAWFYHTGLLALYVYALLAFLPSGAGLSLDRYLRRRRGRNVIADRPTRRFGWARYAVWAAFAIPYVAAGLSKLRNGGLEWWDASNFQFILYQSTLRPMEFDFDVALALRTAPDWLFEVMALTALFGELLYGLVLVSRRARWVLPLAMMLMHVAILFLQNILFFDLIVLQVIFLDARPLAAAIVGRVRNLGIVAPPGIASGVGVAAASVRDAVPALGRRLTIFVTILMAVCWLFRIEFYPLTGMQMFSGTRSEPVVYERALAHLESGDVIRAPIEASIGAMSDGRYRRLLQRAFDLDESATSRAFMNVVADRWNERAVQSERIDRFEIQQWSWSYRSRPRDPDFGDLVGQVVYHVDSTDD